MIIKTILPILKILISSFHLKYAFLFSHCDTDNSFFFDVHLPFVQSVIQSWNISTHLVLSDTLGDNVSCLRSFLYLSPHHLHSHSLVTRQYTSPSFPILFTWISSVLIRLALVLLLQKILLMCSPFLSHHHCSITLVLNCLYNRILTIFSLSWPQSLISFTQLPNHLIFHVLFLSKDGYVSLSHIRFSSLIFVILLLFLCILVLFPLYKFARWFYISFLFVCRIILTITFYP